MLRFLKSLFATAVTPEPVEEFEVYYPGWYSFSSGHCHVAFVGTEAECDSYLLDSDERRRLAIRPTGQLVTAVGA